MLFSAKQEVSSSKWSGKSQTYEFFQRIDHTYEHYGGNCCCHQRTSVKLKWTKVFGLVLVIMLFMFLWKNTPVVFRLASETAFLQRPSCVKCPPCGQEDNEMQPDIQLDYEAEIVHEEESDKTTVGPPPTSPDQLYVKNLTQLRPLAEFSLTPWKVLESFSQLVDGKDCFHMNPSKKYAPKWSLVIFVKSKSSNFERRTAVRSTWGRVYFLNQIRIEKVFVIGRVDDPAIQAELQAENDIFGDILQFEGPDDYKNMPIKVTSAMQWAAEHMAVDNMYASSDDDFVVDFVGIVDFLEYEVKLQRYKERKKTGVHKSPQSIRMNMPIYCVYYLDKVKGPNRDNASKWFINKEEYSLERYPPYCGGGFYLMPVAMTRDLFQVSRRTKLLAMDDVWITGILRQKLGRGDDNVQKADWPRNTHPADKKNMWIHLWGDYGVKKDIAKLLPKAWKDWDRRLQGRPNCRWPEVDFDLTNLLENEEIAERAEELKKLPIAAQIET